MDVKLRATLLQRANGESPLIHGGFIKVLPASTEYAQLLANALKNYKWEELQVELSDGDSWSDRMNNLLHAIIRKCIGHCSYWNLLGRDPQSFDEVKDWVKVQFGGAKVEIVGAWCHIESWTKFSKRRSIDTIDKLLLWCMEQGIDIDAEKLEHESLGG